MRPFSLHSTSIFLYRYVHPVVYHTPAYVTRDRKVVASLNLAKTVAVELAKRMRSTGEKLMLQDIKKLDRKCAIGYI